MKRLAIMMGMALMTMTAVAKEIQTFVVTTNPIMHCGGCENRIKNGLKFEKGVKDIVTSLDKQTVTIKFDAEKTNKEELTKALKKIGYSVKEVAE